MKITIDISDFYLDPEDQKGLENELKNHVKREVVKEIHKSISDKVKEQITDAISNEIQVSIKPIIDKTLSDLVDSSLIKPRGENEMLIKDYIKKIFENNNGWGSPEEKIKTLAKAYGDEMKKRYDLLFASQLVAKINENGLLKEDVAKKLLEQ
jgi:hypothetical protein